MLIGQLDGRYDAVPVAAAAVVSSVGIGVRMVAVTTAAEPLGDSNLQALRQMTTMTEGTLGWSEWLEVRKRNGCCSCCC